MRYFIFCQSDILLKKTGDNTYAIPSAEIPPVPVKQWTRLMTVTLPTGEEVTTYSIDSPVTDLPNHEMCGLRQSYYILSHEEYISAGKCHEIIYWDKNTRFCGVCGGMMRLNTEISKRCTECGKEVWPQLATAVIALIHRGPDEVLLVRARNFRTNFFGLVAGFVETGETLEEAITREALEETGIKIKNIRYFGSQPWPYPCGIMIGFHADYESGEIHLQESEIAKGEWFHRNNLPTIPEKLSIARMLIDDWLRE